MSELQPNPIRTNRDNPFAHDAITNRLPSALRNIQIANAYPSWINARLDQLIDEVVQNAPVASLEQFAPDSVMWDAELEKRSGETWQDTDWFFAETYLFRKVIEAVRWWETGIDPYKPVKREGLTASTIDMVSDAMNIEGNTESRLMMLFEYALWGNRADLSHPQALAHGREIAHDDLLVDHRDTALESILTRAGPVHIVCDNVGAELAMDLTLVDGFLRAGIPVWMHLKMWPTYISDATVVDVHWMIEWLTSSQVDRAVVLSKRLRMAFENGNLRLAPDLYWNGPTFLCDMPDRIRTAIQGGRMLILKGDANYRRAVNDTIYHVDTSLEDIVSDLPLPVLALRTLKSDPVVGLQKSLVEKLTRTDPEWRTNGKRGLIQFAHV